MTTSISLVQRTPTDEQVAVVQTHLQEMGYDWELSLTRILTGSILGIQNYTPRPGLIFEAWLHTMFDAVYEHKNDLPSIFMVIELFQAMYLGCEADDIEDVIDTQIKAREAN
jgi:hypothetical protein